MQRLLITAGEVDAAEELASALPGFQQTCLHEGIERIGEVPRRHLGVVQATITDLLARFNLLMPDRALYRDAGLLAGWNLRSLDALHVAGVLRLNADTLITYDARQRLAARTVGMKTFAPA